MILIQAMLAEDMLFESGLRLPRGTPIRVRETDTGGTIAYYYDNPKSYSTHCFAIDRSQYSVLVNAKSGEMTYEEVVD